ncbi:MAG: flagellar protein FlgN [Gammaproteobacteria bacterium]|nr:flagellar protein FlgN [Gammaproteobacteria bacterium]
MQFSSAQKLSLSSFIEEELELARSMYTLLKSEYEALTDGNPKAITAISKKKLEQLRWMEQHLQQVNAFLLELGLTADTHGAEQAIARTGPDNKLQAKWDELRSVEVKLQRQNEINGGIITIGQRRVKQALDILSGKEGLTGTYGQDGGTQFSNSNNLHTKA